MKRLLALLGCFPLVWVRRYDGRAYLRRAVDNHFGEWVVTSRFWGDTYQLLRDGTLRPDYLTHWREWKYNRKHVVFQEGR